MDWSQDIFTKLRLRNAKEVAPFLLVIKQNQVLLEQGKKLQAKNNELLVAINSRPPMDSLGGSSLPSNMNKEVDMAKMQKLTDDLYNAYKKIADNSQQLLELNTQVKQKQGEAETKMHQIKQLEAQLDKQQQTNQQLQEELQERNITIDVLKDELQALQIELVKSEEKSRDLAKENKVVLERFMKLKEAEAVRMNEANIMFQEAQETQQKAQLLAKVQQQSAASNVKISELDASILDKQPQKPTVDVQVPKRTKKSFTVANGAELTSIAYSWNGNVFATAGADKTVRIWDARAGTPRSVMVGAMEKIMCVDFSSNDEFVLAASNDNATRVWSIQQGRIRHTLTGHIGKVFSAVFSLDSTKVVTGSHDRTLKIWDLNKGYCVRTIFCFSSCNDVCLSPDAMLICSGHFDNTVRFWDPKTGETAHELPGVHTGQVTSVKLSPDGHYLLSNSRDNTIKIIDVRTFDVLHTLRHDTYRNGLNWARATWSPDGTYVIAGSFNGSVLVWDTRNSKVDTILKGHKTSVTSCAWNPNGFNLASCDKNGQVFLWD